MKDNSEKPPVVENKENAKIEIPDLQYYSCVALCAFDAVFSIRAKYDTVVSPLIDRFCQLVNIPRKATDPYSIPDVDSQVKVSDLIKKIEGYDAESLAEKIGNKQRTSTRNGILKTQAFLEYMKVFQELKIETYQDVSRNANELKMLLRQIKGQNVSVDYFFVLAGVENK